MTARRLGLIALPVVFVAAVVIARSAIGHNATHRTQAAQAALVPTDATASVTPVGPTAVVAGAPSGFRHDKAGAIAAALGFLSVGPAVVGMNDTAAMAAQRQMATTEAAEAMAADLRSRLAAMRDGFGPGRIGYRVAPLAVRADEADGDHIDIAVWYVAVVEPPASAAYADWRIVRYQLVWERSDWHETAEHDEPGPHPSAMTANQPTLPGAWAAELEGFNPIGASDA